MAEKKDLKVGEIVTWFKPIKGMVYSKRPVEIIQLGNKKALIKDSSDSILRWTNFDLLEKIKPNPITLPNFGHYSIGVFNL